MTFTPCSPRHTSCSPAHAELVRGYQAERYRQWETREVILGMFNRDGMMRIWRENGGRLVTFGDWLRWHKRQS